MYTILLLYTVDWSESVDWFSKTAVYMNAFLKLFMGTSVKRVKVRVMGLGLRNSNYGRSLQCQPCQRFVTGRVGVHALSFTVSLLPL